MSKKIIIDANYDQIRVALIDGKNNIENIEYANNVKEHNKNNIYLAKITRIEASLQAAFIDYGSDKSGFLPFTDIHSDYYNISEDDQKDNLIKILQHLNPSEIHLDEVDQKENIEIYSNSILNENEDIDISTIEKLVDEKIISEFTLEASDIEDVDVISHVQTENLNEKKQDVKIQDVLKNGQILLVQLTKEKRANKGASFTTYISIAGKYCVLMPNTSSQNGVSRKISNAEERKRLKNIINKVTSANTKEKSSMIIRTAGISKTTLDIKRDYDYLIKLWNNIREITIKSNAPSFIHEEDGIIQKTIRDLFDQTVRELIIQGEVAYKQAFKVMTDMLPTEMFKLQEYKSKIPIFTQFSVETQLSNLYQPVSPLPSGGYIVINPTEALTSIDVNSGKATSENSIEETAFKTNIEATKEIARQLRLRDISGLVVIDFIDMMEIKNRRIVERSFREFLSKDKARVQTTNISQFGLVEMSRQRLNPSFLEANSSICSHCNGKGIVRADDANAMLILRTVENEISNKNVDIVNVYANIISVIYILNNKRNEISLLENKSNIKLNFRSDPNATADSYSIEVITLQKISDVVNNEPVNLQNIISNKKPISAKQKWNNKHNRKKITDETITPENKDTQNVAITTNNQKLKNNNKQNYKKISNDHNSQNTETNPIVEITQIENSNKNINENNKLQQHRQKINQKIVNDDHLKNVALINSQPDILNVNIETDTNLTEENIQIIRKKKRRNNFRKRQNKEIATISTNNNENIENT
jgi:ribonuclease E